MKEKVEIDCRCKDCRHFQKEGKYKFCYYWEYETGMSPNEVEEDGFCSNGERK